MGIFRALINNTFFVLLLLVVTTLYIAFSDSIKEDHGIEPTTQTAVQHIVLKDEAVSNKQPSSMNGTEKKSDKSMVVAQLKPQSKEVKPDLMHDHSPANVSEKSKVAEPKMEKSEKKVEEAVSSTTPANTPNSEEDAIEHSKKSLDENRSTAIAEMNTPTVAAPKVSEKTVQMSTKTSEKVDKAQKIKTTNQMTMKDAQKILSAYPSLKEAMSAAIKAYQDKNYKKAEEILFALSLWQPTPDLLGALGNVFYTDHKIDWAKRAWAAGAEQLIHHGEVAKAAMVANKLKKAAPSLSKEILHRIQLVKK